MKSKVNCTFCGQPLTDNNFISGVNESKLCFNCVYNSKEILDKNLKLETNKVILNDLSSNKKNPLEIYDILNKFIIGQDQAKKKLSVAVYNHFNRIIYNLEEKKDVAKVEIEKSNVLLIGPSGSGKTLLAKTLAGIVNLPFVITDATTLTEAGYVGDDVENILLRLIEKANYNIELAEKGIIFIDEIDKIGRKGESASITRDVSGEGVQQALLKIIEGTVSSVPARGGRKHPQSQNFKINTENILFICGGAFIGIDEIVRSRLKNSQIGFKNPSESEDNFSLDEEKIIQKDLIKFGLIPELVGRLPIVTTLSELTREELKRVITEPRNSILEQFKKYLSFDDIKLKIDDKTIDFLIDKAHLELGARSLKSVFEAIIQDVIFIASKHRGETLKLTPKSITDKTYFGK